MTTLFWFLLAIVLYVYAGYPLLLLAIRTFGGRRPIVRDSAQPDVTLIISAYNEEDVIADKLSDTLALDYPKDRLQIIVVSDASEDATDAIVTEFAPHGVELLRMAERGGKTVGLNEAVRKARGEIVVFSDANALYGRDALRKLVRNFADPLVGAAVGESTYLEPTGESERSESLYWRYETAIKRLESEVGSVVGGDGAIYAIRRSLYVPMRADAISDFVNPLQIVKSGHRCVYESEARSYERAADDFKKEFRRKVRIVNRAWRALARMAELLNPARYGLFAFELISHKLLRWLIPLFLVALLASNALILDHHPAYEAMMVTQLVLYALAIIGHLLRNRESIPAIVSVPYFFCLVNLASALGIIDAIRGRTYTTWTTARAKQT